MRCNPLRWLLGLIPILLLAGVAILAERERIEKDLAERSQKALEAAGFGWARAAFDGRDALISGLAFEEAEPDGANKLVARTHGVRIVHSDARLIDKVERYDWVAVRRDSRIRLGGLVPNEKTRREIIGIARAMFPRHEIADKMTLARGAPSLDTWLGGVGFGLKQLALLKSGSVHLDITELTVTGEAVDAPAFRAVKTALATGLPPGISLKADKVEAPVVTPYVWVARLTGDQLDIRGSVPSEKVREDLLTAARRAIPRAKTADAMTPARGDPEGWEPVVRGVLRELGRLEEGSAEVRDQTVTVAGVAVKEATADDVRDKLKELVPASYRLVERITFREPTIKTVSPYVTGFSLDESGGIGTLTGYVPSEAARAALLALAQTRFPGRRIVDRLELGAGPIPGWQRCLDAGLSAVARLGNGVLELTDRRLAVTGETESEALARSLPAEMRAAANRDCDADAQVTLKAKPEPMLRWSATIHEAGEVILDGQVPGAAVRDALVADARRIFAPRDVIDRMVIVGEPSERWQRTALVALTQLARLRLGRAQIVNQDMSIEGEARDVVAHAAIRDIVARTLPDGYHGEETIVVRSDAMIAAEQASLRKAEEDEKRRIEAEAEAKRNAAEARERAEAEERTRAAEEAQRRVEEEARRQRLAAEIRQHAEAEARRRAAEEEARMREALAARQRADAEARKRADADERPRFDEGDLRRRVEETARQSREAETRRQAEQEQQRQEQQRKQEVVDACNTALRPVTKQGEIHFDWASARLDRRSYPTLRRIAEAARTCPGVTIDIEGHTDSEGTDERNQPLSERRAQSVVDFLIDAGVPAERMKAIGYGSTRPIAPNETAADRARNRRIEFTVKAN